MDKPSPASDLTAPGDGPLLDPDCRAAKHASCVGGPCECTCHWPEQDDGREARREALIAEHGQPVHYPEADACRLLGGAAAGLNVTDVTAWRYPTREAARAFHQLNHERHGHTSLGITADPDGGGFIGVMDIRQALGQMRAANEAQQRRE